MLKISLIISIITILCSCTPETRGKTSESLIRFSKGFANYYTMPTRGTPVYSSGQCVGAQVMGKCHGGVIGTPVATCHGEMLNGMCTGPMF